jgi:hypothetical protein
MRKLQIPSFKFQRSTKGQAPNCERLPAALEFGFWIFFGIWNLEFGILQ